MRSPGAVPALCDAEPVPGPPDALRRALVDGPSRIARLDWHDVVPSTNDLAAAAARAGCPEITLVGAEEQTAGRGRAGRAWTAPRATSLLVSFVLRPRVPQRGWPALPLVAGVALAEVADAFVGRSHVALKWPNDLLLDGRKAGGILAESAADAVVVGIGLDVDWRGVTPPPELPPITSLAEVADAEVDRWRVLAALCGVLANRYDAWQDDPEGTLAAYRPRCATLGNAVRAERVGHDELLGEAVGIDVDGALLIRRPDGGVERHLAGDVHLQELAP